MRFVMLLWLAGCLFLGGCSSREEPFVWQVDQPAENLDPQAAQFPADQLAIRHLYRGLFALGQEGRPQPDGCGSWGVSSDGLVYTFTLARDLTWWDGTPVTAQDYAYGLARALDEATGCPDREALGLIEQVTCPDPATLTITLTQPGDLTQLLCLPGAMPCREDFFRACQGNYGLTRKSTLGNGRFSLQRWSDTVLTLARRQGEGLETLRLASPQSGLVPTGWFADSGAGAGTPAITWALVLNPQCPPFQSLSVRQSLASASYAAQLPLGPGLVRAGQFLPPTFGQAEALPQLGDAPPLLWAGLEQVGQESVKGLTLTIPDRQPLKGLGTALNQWFQQELGLFFMVEELPVQDLEAKAFEGEYDLLLLPCQAQCQDPQAFFDRWGSLAGMEGATDRQLLDSGYFIPLCHQSLWLETQEPMEGLWFSPYTCQPDFNFAAYQ